MSLTKHGAHKVASLLSKYDKDEVLNHLVNSEPGINIEAAQAKKTLAADTNGIIPELWNKARARGTETLHALVLAAVILSHYELIATMRKGASKREFLGSIKRGAVIDGKEYTNFAHIIDELGYSTFHSAERVDFALHKFFNIKGLSALFAELLARKLKGAGWDAKNDLVDEAIALGIHEAFARSEHGFRKWLVSDEVSPSDGIDRGTEDFFSGATDEKRTAKPYRFRPGHKTRKTGTVAIAPRGSDSEADLLHNAIQNALYAQLAKEYGSKHVGTEVDTGEGTSIDIVVHTDKFCRFYEIKTAASAKACIRQALPQLLEYAYWDCDDDRAERLIIVSPLPLTFAASKYLEFLKSRFGLPLDYLHFPVGEYDV